MQEQGDMRAQPCSIIHSAAITLGVSAGALEAQTQLQHMQVLFLSRALEPFRRGKLPSGQPVWPCIVPGGRL